MPIAASLASVDTSSLSLPALQTRHGAHWRFACALQDDEPDENVRQAEHAVRFLWRFILMPLLFTLIGTTINFSTLSTSTIQKACALIFAGQLLC